MAIWGRMSGTRLRGFTFALRRNFGRVPKLCANTPSGHQRQLVNLLHGLRRGGVVFRVLFERLKLIMQRIGRDGRCRVG